MKDLISKLPDDRAINALIIELKKKPTNEMQRIVVELLRSDSRDIRYSALRIAQRMIQDRNALLHILDMGLERQDVSEVRFWIAAVAHGLGYKRLIKRLGEVANDQPALLVYAWYQLVPLVREKSPDNLAFLSSVSSVVDKGVATLSQDLQEYWARTKVAVPLV